ncbi:MAG: hypothetical protein NTX50_03215 [Candidatus Sumerlaeota bacterium]|nr:hypothetical protein [Candidatus Sumerlaeota bacterium]
MKQPGDIGSTKRAESVRVPPLKYFGKEFLREVQKAVEDIEEHPEQWPIVRNNIRQRLLQRFPYAVIYLDFLSW